MNLFQWLSLGVLLLAVVAELRHIRRERSRRITRLLRLVVWLSAIAAIAMPEATSALAAAIGIGRGADLVLYLFILVFLGTSFHLYARSAMLERQVTELARREAIREAKAGSRQ